MPDEPKELSKVTAEDVDSVTKRLQEWVPTLPEQEQLVLGWMLTRAAAAEDSDVKEYVEQQPEGGVPVSSLMAEAAGMQDVSGYALPIHTIGPIRIWTFRW